MILIMRGLKQLFVLVTILQMLDFQVKVALMPDGLDPDEYIK